MAIRTDLADDIKNHSHHTTGTEWDEEWDGHTGLEVESFITEKLKNAEDKQVVNMDYLDQKLKLVFKDGTYIEKEVTPVEPTYIYGIKLYRFKVDNEMVAPTGSDYIFQYKLGKSVKVGVIFYALTLTTTTSNSVGTFYVKFDYGANNSCQLQVLNIDYNKIKFESAGGVETIGGNIIGLKNPETGEMLTDETEIENNLVWADITQLFTTSRSNQTLTGTVLKDTDKKDSYSDKITVQKIDLVYSGSNYITSSPSIAFLVKGADTQSNYHIKGWNYYTESGELKLQTINTTNGLLSVEELHPGLNQLVVKASHNNSNISSDYINLDIIYTTDDVVDTVVAVNEVSANIPNNGVATLYKLTVYSANKNSLTLSTYLEDDEPQENNPLQLVKQESISASSYNDANLYNTDYKKYIEIESNNDQKYLMIKVGDSFYNFYTVSTRRGQDEISSNSYKTMTIEALDETLVYTKLGVSSKFNFDQSTGYSNGLLVTKDYATPTTPQTISDTIESSDGWKETDGRVYFKMSAQANPILSNPINLGLSDTCTIEMGFKTYNVSDESKPILTIGDFQLRSNLFCWNIDNKTTFLARNAQFENDVENHLVITIEKNHKMAKGDTYYPTYLGTAESVALSKTSNYQESFDSKIVGTTYNLIRIYINGVIDRSIVLNDADLNSIISSSLLINPTGCDTDFYLFRVYTNTVLSMDEVLLNYIAFLLTKAEKLKLKDFNDILNGNGEISFDKCYGKFNTIVYVLPKGCRVPSRFWGGEDDVTTDKKAMKNFPVTTFINYADEDINKVSGGKIVNNYLTGQGSSAMRYMIWNCQSAFGKFKDYKVDAQGNYLNKDGEVVTSEKEAATVKRPTVFINYSDEMFDSESQNFKNTDAVKYDGYYVMPTYTNQKYQGGQKVKKLVGKVNFASSMQSHKLGAVKLYNDAYKDCSYTAALPNGDMKACTEEPFLYFFWESDKSCVKAGQKVTVSKQPAKTWHTNVAGTDDVNLTNLSELFNNPDVHFMGFQTWGSAKADDATYGYDEDLFPEYILIEGGENTDTAVNFRCPWHALQRVDVLATPGIQKVLTDFPVISKETSLAEPWSALLIDNESIVYNSRGALDVDYGLEELKDPNDTSKIYYEFTSAARPSVKKFREFFDTVYKYDYSYKVTNELAPTTDWNTNFRYCMSKGGLFKSASGYEFTVARGDLLRYEEYSDRWVPAGLYYDTTNNKWESLNVYDMSSNITTSDNLETTVRAEMRDLFKENIEQYLDIYDIAFHLAFIKFLSGTDNRAKNTYFVMFGPKYDTPILYTEETATAANAKLEGAVKAGDAAIETDTVSGVSGTYTAELAKVYNASLEGAVSAGDDTGDKAATITLDSYKIRLNGDDLDTVLLTDNNGLQSKAYNLLEDSYLDLATVQSKDYESDWGDAHNALFYMFDQCYEDKIKKCLQELITFCFRSNNSLTDSSNYFVDTFFGVLEYYPQIAYNHTSKIYYETAKFVLLSGCMGDIYKNNGVDPIEQAHGSGLPGERNFMKKRLSFLGSYALSSSTLGSLLPTASSAGSGASITLKLKFTPYLDFYPTLNWSQVAEYLNEKGLQTSEYDTIKYLANTDIEYNVNVVKSNSSINLGLYGINNFKKLDITGLKLSSFSGTFSHLTDLTIDNNNLITYQSVFGSSYPKLEISSFEPTMPVLENLKLNNIVLPSRINLSAMTKLLTVDLSGSTILEVVLPECGSLKTVILPESITSFSLYNNPGIEEITFEEDHMDNLTTVFINCANTGAFNVADFCEKLVNCLNLSSVTLQKASLHVTEDVINKFSQLASCNISGDIYIVNSAAGTTLQQISLDTKKALINKFGTKNSSETTNGTETLLKLGNVTFHYRTKEVSEFTNAVEVQLYSSTYPAVKPNAFNVKVETGNDIAVLINPTTLLPQLDIQYAINTGSTIATINKYTGEITLLQNSSTYTGTATVTIKVTRTNGTTMQHTSSVSFKWSAPKIGQFAYADGSFSSGYDSTKTCVGLVYKVVPNTDESTGATLDSGTAYIIGKEFSNSTAHYAGYLTGGNTSSQDTISKELGYLENLLTSTYLISNYDTVSGIKTASNLIDNIVGSSSDILNFTSDQFSGKSDTLAYVNHVSNWLKALYNKNNNSIKQYIGTKQVTSDGNTTTFYYIRNTSDLNSLANALKSLNPEGVSSGSSTITSTLFPYFYSMYLYLPEIEHPENSDDVLDDQYKSGNWYAPSYYELANVIYYRGYSASKDFLAVSNVAENINTSLSGAKAIFSVACNNMKTVPAAWSGLVSGSANMVTTCGNNLNYQYTDTSNYSSTATYTWATCDLSSYTNSWGGNTTAFRLLQRKGVPFTQFNYSKS